MKRKAKSYQGRKVSCEEFLETSCFRRAPFKGSGQNEECAAGISLKADQWSKLKKGLKILEAAKSSD